MKFNWGTGIALFYGTFVAVLLFFVLKSTGQDNSLVSEDYYTEDLKYQEHYEKLQKTAALQQDLIIRTNDGLAQVEFTFPEKLGKAGGEILFFCPSDSHADFRVPIQVNESAFQAISSRNLKKGFWKIKVDWQAGGEQYYKETGIVF